MRYFRRKRPCEACGKIVGRTEKALEFPRLQLDGPPTPSVIHQSCFDAAESVTYMIPPLSDEDYFAQPS